MQIPLLIKTERPNPLMLFDVAQLYVLKQEIAEVGTEEQVADNVIGTGRYKFVEQVKEDHIDLAQTKITGAKFRLLRMYVSVLLQMKQPEPLPC